MADRSVPDAPRVSSPRALGTPPGTPTYNNSQFGATESAPPSGMKKKSSMPDMSSSPGPQSTRSLVCPSRALTKSLPPGRKDRPGPCRPAGGRPARRRRCRRCPSRRRAGPGRPCRRYRRHLPHRRLYLCRRCRRGGSRRRCHQYCPPAPPHPSSPPRAPQFFVPQACPPSRAATGDALSLSRRRKGSGGRGEDASPVWASSGASQRMPE